MIGGGFGGSVLGLVKRSERTRIAGELRMQFPEYAIYELDPSNGVCVLNR